MEMENNFIKASWYVYCKWFVQMYSANDLI